MKKVFSVLVLLFALLPPCASLHQLAFSTTPRASDSSATASSPYAFAQKVSLGSVPNAGRISEHLFRGAQPHISDLQRLKDLGITTIIDLRSESSGTRQEERLRAESLGMHFVSIPVGGFSTPSSAQLAQFFTLVRQSPPEKIFVHCRFGHDRTGVFIAAYRIAFNHWSAEQALAEMNAFGFNHAWHPSMITYVHELPRRLEGDAVLKSALAN
jgi:tyrosine-protein phosphatase SIW14